MKKYFGESIGDSKTVQKFEDHLRERPVVEASCFLPLKWQSLQQRRTYLTHLQTFKMLHGADCIEFNKYFAYSRAPQTRSCNASTLQCGSSRVNSFRYSYFVAAPFLWNKLPADVSCACTYNSFRSKLVRTFLFCTT